MSWVERQPPPAPAPERPPAVAVTPAVSVPRPVFRTLVMLAVARAMEGRMAWTRPFAYRLIVKYAAELGDPERKVLRDTLAAQEPALNAKGWRAALAALGPT